MGNMRLPWSTPNIHKRQLQSASCPLHLLSKAAVQIGKAHAEARVWLQLRPLRVPTLWALYRVHWCAAKGQCQFSPPPGPSRVARATAITFESISENRQNSDDYTLPTVPKRRPRLLPSNPKPLGLSGFPLFSLAVGRQAVVAASSSQLHPLKIVAASVSNGRRHRTR